MLVLIKQTVMTKTMFNLAKKLGVPGSDVNPQLASTCSILRMLVNYLTRRKHSVY
jgi:hypothetical protein